MWRTLVAVLLAYGCGHPGLAGYRPSILDIPLQALHQDVNTTAVEGHKMLAALSGQIRDLIARRTDQTSENR